MAREDMVAVLVHRSCGHVAGAAPTTHRRHLEGQRKLIEAAGYHQWRVRTERVDALEGRLMVVCDTCRIDPSRGLLPAVVEAQLADPDVRDAAAAGALAALLAGEGSG